MATVMNREKLLEMIRNKREELVALELHRLKDIGVYIRDYRNLQELKRELEIDARH